MNTHKPILQLLQLTVVNTIAINAQY